MEKKDIIATLETIANIMEIKGENPFRSRAFHNAARVLEGQSKDIQTLVETGELRELQGIGAGLNDEITAMVETGKSPHLEQIKGSVPEGVLEMLEIPGLGPKKVKILFKDLGVRNIGELEYACKENRLSELKGFGTKTQENVLKGIELLRKSAGRFLFNEAYREAKALCEMISKEKGVLQCHVAGSLRRYKETIGDIDILASVRSSGDALMKKLSRHAQVEDVLVSGETKTSVRLKGGLQVDLRVVRPEEYPFALIYFTGSKEHNTVLRSIAKEKGYKLNEYGLFKGKKSLPCKDEAQVYRALGLHYIPPEARENFGEIEWARKKPFPELIQEKDLQGVFHVHSTWSDGGASILEMGQEAERLGFKYMGLSDHSQTAFYAGGLKPKDLARQAKEVAAANKKLKKLTILQGTESDILSDGALDYEKTTLNKLDFVIASIHSGFKMEKTKMTKRIIQAIADPHTRFVGHISGRLLLAREGFQLDYDAIFEAAAKHNVAIEINANPHRFDLDWRHLRRAREAGVKFSINPDAHAVGGLADAFYGVGIARKGWLTKKDVINTMGLKEVREYLRDHH
jgi:DNA polymerase (family 10)